MHPMSGFKAWPNRASIPNLLTILRAAMAAAFFLLLEFYEFPDSSGLLGNLAIALFILAAGTDALDGFLARRWNVTSSFGRVMDPLCDKLLVLGAFIYLCGPNFRIVDLEATSAPFSMATGIYPWMAVVILARELFVTTVRALAEGSGIQFGAKSIGKIKMIFQSIAIPVILALVVNLPPTDYPWSGWICISLGWATVLITLISGLPYLKGINHIGDK